jgi:glutamate synthase (NADPH/NADH)
VLHPLSPDPREYCISTKEFIVDNEKLSGLNTGKLLIKLLRGSRKFIICTLHTVRVEWTKDSSGRWKMEEVPGSEKCFPAQLVLLALGFLGPQAEVINALGVKQDSRSNIETPPKVRFTDNPLGSH